MPDAAHGQRSARSDWFLERVAGSPASLFLIALTAAGAIVVGIFPSTMDVFAVPGRHATSSAWLPVALFMHALLPPTGSVWLSNSAFILLCGVSVEPELRSHRVLWIGVAASIVSGVVYHFLGTARGYVGPYPITVGMMGAVLGMAPRFWRTWGVLRRLLAGFSGLLLIVGVGAGVSGSETPMSGGAWAGLLAGLLIALAASRRLAPARPSATT